MSSSPDLLDVVGELAGLSSHERQPRLAELQEREPDLAREATRLLGRQAAANAFFRRASAACSDGTARRVPAHIGPYRVQRPIGRGGMGDVYLAEDSSGRRVAVKTLAYRGVSFELRRRFDQEQRTLAELRHPNVVALIDHGSDDDDVPYLVMEYVEGVSVDSYVRSRGLGPREIVQLFEALCAGLAFAHRNLVIHRDLKPSNVMVTRSGQPKIVDFGIAKLLDPEGVGAHTTATGWDAMTVAYASPEQHLRKALTTSSDLYALGVLLFELLAGRRPFECATDVDLRHAIVHRDAPRMSEVAPPQLRRLLRGDLDAIVARALAREPDARYPTVDALRADLRAYLGGGQVSARPATALTRMAGWTRRHARAVAAGALCGAALAGGYARELYHRDQVQQTRHDLTVQQHAKRVTATTLMDLILQVPGDGYVDRTTLARSALDILERRSGPGVTEDAYWVWLRSVILNSTGQYESAAQALSSATEFADAFSEENPGQMAQLLDLLAVSLIRDGRFETAEPVVRRGLELKLRRMANKPEHIAQSELMLGGLLRERGKLWEAFARIESALRRQIDADASPRNVQTTRRKLARVALALGDAETAWVQLTAADEIGRAHPRFEGAAQRMWGQWAARQGDLPRALQYYEDAVVDLRLAKVDGYSGMCGAMAEYGSLLVLVGDLPGARDLLAEAVSQSATLRPGHHCALLTQLSVAELHDAYGEPITAETIRTEVEAAERALHGPAHPHVGRARGRDPWRWRSDAMMKG